MVLLFWCLGTPPPRQPGPPSEHFAKRAKGVGGGGGQLQEAGEGRGGHGSEIEGRLLQCNGAARGYMRETGAVCQIVVLTRKRCSFGSQKGP